MATALVVDDSMIMRKKIIKILDEMGHSCVAEAKDGFEACIAYRKLTPEFVTMDITMPGMDGITAVKEIKREFPEAIIIMVTSHGQENMVIESIQNGASGYILKPLKKDKLEAALEACEIFNQDNSEKKPIPKEEEEKEKQQEDNEKEDEIIEEKPLESLKRFDIENRSGIFVVQIETVYKTLNFDIISQIRDKISGLYIVRPLNFIFNFDKIESFENLETYEEFFELIKDIRDEDGLIRLFITNQDMADIIAGSEVKSSIKILDNMPD